MNKDLLQFEEWFRFQEAAGNEVVRMTDDGFSFGGIVYSLPLAGRYLYTPRWPQSGNKEQGTRNREMQILLAEAQKHGCGWVRVEPETEAVLGMIRGEIPRQARDDNKKDETLRQPARHVDASHAGGAQGDNLMIVRAPHDMQPRETFVVDISKGEAELLAAMKSKTRYNVRLAEKKGVRVFQTTDEKYRQAFIDLVTGTADRKGIVPHPRAYYEAMLKTLLGDTAMLFVAEHEGDILGINFMTYHEGTATYLHGGSSDTKREFMAPFLLQWEAMKDAKRRGCNFYDFGGIRIHSKIENRKSSIDSWAGITRFKVGFSPETAPTVFPGCYDIVFSPSRYFLYKLFSFVRSRVAKIGK